MAKRNKNKIAEEVSEVTNEEAQQMIESGEAEIPQDAVMNEEEVSEIIDLPKSNVENDFANHPKFSKFKTVGGK